MKKIYLFTVLVLVFGATFAQSIFDNPITGTNPNIANPYTTGQTVNANITVSGIGRGIGITGFNANDRYNANSWNTAVLDLTAYFEFILTPNAGRSINFISCVYSSQVSNTNISNFAFRSSLDGFTTDIGTPTATTTATVVTINLSAPAYQNIITPITFRIYAWGPAAAAPNTFSINDFTFNGVTSVLPITVEYLNGTKQSNGHSLAWKVNCTSSSFATLVIERSADAVNFTPVNTITATYLRCQQPFDYTDNSPLPGRNYYRLKMTDDNGSVTYSSMIVLLNKESGFDIAGLLPSVVKTTAILNVSAAQKTKMNVVVTDLLGKQVQQQTYSLVAGSNQLQMNFSNLPSGAYQIIGYTAGEKSATIRFIKQ